jgi:uncharacterized protein
VRVVLDANIFLSALPRLRDQDSPPRKILGAWLAGEIDVVISGHIIEEVSRNLRKPYFAARLEGIDAIRIWEEIRLVAEVVELQPQEPLPQLASHPEDDYVLATVLEGKADYLVTGDRQLQKLGSIGNVTIVSPAEMLRIIEMGG